jgi:hypothetical protein
MTDTDEQARRHRSANATIAALTRAARTDGGEISAPARRAFLEQFETRHECKFCGVVEIDQTMPPEQRARAAAAARKLHFTRLATASSLARAAEAKAAAIAHEAEAQLDADMAELDVS